MPVITFDNAEHMLPGQGDEVYRVQNALNGVQPDIAVSPASSSAYQLVTMSVPIPDAATTTYSYITADKVELVDVIVRKSVAGAGNTIQVKNGSGTAISDAIAAAVDKAITRAGTIDPATATLNAGDTFQITATRAAGSMLANVTLVWRRRA
jgi:hypothetical protein